MKQIYKRVVLTNTPTYVGVLVYIYYTYVGVLVYIYHICGRISVYIHYIYTIYIYGIRVFTLFITVHTLTYVYA